MHYSLFVNTLFIDALYRFQIKLTTLLSSTGKNISYETATGIRDIIEDKLESKGKGQDGVYQFERLLEQYRRVFIVKNIYTDIKKLKLNVRHLRHPDDIKQAKEEKEKLRLWSENKITGIL